MTNSVFPTFQGWSYHKEITPQWKTNVYESTSGKENRVQKWSYPRYKICLNYNFMTDNSVQSVSLDKGDIEKLQGFFNSVGGNSEDFLFLDELENSCENQVFGVGDASTKEFQLLRSLPDWTEPVNGILTQPTIKVNGTTVSNYTWDNFGRIVFNTAPALDAVLTWSGTYYFRVRFEEEELELSRTFDGLWEGIEVNLITVK